MQVGALTVAVEEPWPQSTSWGSVEATCVIASGWKECLLKRTVDYDHGRLRVIVIC